tara:strand:+ start:133 stop:777 length:645 start_codon:yes stop_codon:yes gene_type:complete
VINPADKKDLSGGLRAILGKFIASEMEGKLPCEVVAVRGDRQRVTVKPLIAKISEDGQIISREQLASVPVQALGAGDMVLSFNMNVGDLGWIDACDRDIREFLRTYKESSPSTMRMYDFNNGVFVPDIMTNYTITSGDEGAALLQTRDGSVKIAIHSDKVVVKAPNIYCEGAVHLGGDDDAPPIARIGDLVRVGGVSSAGDWPIISGSSEHTAT